MDIQALQQENAVLKQHTEVLHHCWQDAQRRAESSSRRCRALIEDISERDAEIQRLEQQIKEYEAHLNPTEGTAKDLLDFEIQECPQVEEAA